MTFFLLLILTSKPIFFLCKCIFSFNFFFKKIFCLLGFVVFLYISAVISSFLLNTINSLSVNKEDALFFLPSFMSLNKFIPSLLMHVLRLSLYLLEHFIAFLAWYSASNNSFTCCFIVALIYSTAAYNFP